jgi:hypothetical protein
LLELALHENLAIEQHALTVESSSTNRLHFELALRYQVRSGREITMSAVDRWDERSWLAVQACWQLRDKADG